MKKDLKSPFSSRQYMLSEDFELYYYRDVTPLRLTAHQHNYYEICFLVSGKIYFEIGGKDYPINPCDFIIIPPGIRHRAVITSQKEPYERFVLWISRRSMEKLWAVSEEYRYLFPEGETGDGISRKAGILHHVWHTSQMDFHSLERALLNILEEMHSDRFGREEMMALRVQALLLRLNRMAYEQEHPRMSYEGQEVHKSVLDYIEVHFQEDLTLEQLSDVFFVNKYHIAHTFKEHFGLSVHQYVIKRRLEACRNAIVAREAITDVYPQYGFKDYSTFYRAFKKEYGLSPREYQERLNRTDLLRDEAVSKTVSSAGKSTLAGGKKNGTSFK